MEVHVTIKRDGVADNSFRVSTAAVVLIAEVCKLCKEIYSRSIYYLRVDIKSTLLSWKSSCELNGKF